MEGEEVWRKKNLLTFEQTGSTGGGTGTGMERCRSKDEVTLQEQEETRWEERQQDLLLPATSTPRQSCKVCIQMAQERLNGWCRKRNSRWN